MKAHSLIRSAVGALALLVVASPQARAHPHVWVTAETRVLYGPGQKIVGLRHKWTFDEFYSAFAIQGLDTNGDGELDAKELAPLAEENVSALVEFDYFTFMKAGGEPVAHLAPRDYHVELAGGIVTLHFTLPLKTPLDGGSHKVTFSVYDPTYYVDFSFAKSDPVTLARSAPRGCRARISGSKVARADMAQLGEAFFSSLTASSTFGADLAETVTIACRAG